MLTTCSSKTQQKKKKARAKLKLAIPGSHNYKTSVGPSRDPRLFAYHLYSVFAIVEILASSLTICTPSSRSEESSQRGRFSAVWLLFRVKSGYF